MIFSRILATCSIRALQAHAECRARSPSEVFCFSISYGQPYCYIVARLAYSWASVHEERSLSRRGRRKENSLLSPVRSLRFVLVLKCMTLAHSDDFFCFLYEPVPLKPKRHHVLLVNYTCTRRPRLFPFKKGPGLSFFCVQTGNEPGESHCFLDVELEFTER